MADDLVLVEKNPAVVDYRARAQAFHDEALALVVDSDEAQVHATFLLANAAGLTKAAEAKRVEIVRPPNDFVKKVNEIFRQVLKPIVDGDTALRGRILAYVREKNRKAAEAAAEAERQRLESEAMMRQAEKAEAAGKAEIAAGLLDVAVAREEGAKQAALEIAPAPKTLSTPMGSTTVRLVWAFRVIEPGPGDTVPKACSFCGMVPDTGKVPRAYLVLDESRVREAIRQGVREIPGLEIFQDESLSVRR